MNAEFDLLEKRLVALRGCGIGHSRGSRDTTPCDELPEDAYQRLDDLIAWSPCQSSAVFVPVVDTSDDGRSFLAIVSVAEGDELPVGLDVPARDAIRAAVADAWKIVEGPGAPPPVAVRMDLSGAPGEGVGGPPLYLGVYLSAVAHFASEVIRANVVATGHPEETMRRDVLDAKIRVSERARSEVGHGEVLTCGRDLPRPRSVPNRPPGVLQTPEVCACAPGAWNRL